LIHDSYNQEQELDIPVWKTEISNVVHLDRTLIIRNEPIQRGEDLDAYDQEGGKRLGT